jgi:nitroreductase/FMN reductase [NAD(P)H]
MPPLFVEATMASDDRTALAAALQTRFGEEIPLPPDLHGADALARLAGHRTQRRYLDQPIAPELLRLLCACALSAPSKSDLQQADILVVRRPELRSAIADLLPDMPWVRQAPEFLVFLANGRRLKQLFALRDRPFPNDHLDQFFNATADAAIVLATFLQAAAAAGLGCCPISVIRDHAARVSELLQLPERVIPLAGLCVGWPAEDPGITPRLDLGITLHEDRFDDADLPARLDAYDQRRAAQRPYRGQRAKERFGEASFYGWSEDKARQYSVPQRAEFGAFVRGKGFGLE